MSDIEYSVIKSDVIKSFDCKMSPNGVLVSQAIRQIESAIVYLMYLLDYKMALVESFQLVLHAHTCMCL